MYRLNKYYTMMIVAGVTPPAVISGGCPNFGRMLGHSISILLTTYANDIPTMQDHAAQPARKISFLGFAAKYAAQPARKSSSFGFAAKYAAQPARKSSSLGFAAKYAAQPARKSSSLGFAAKYAAQLMDDILTPIPIELRPFST
jgi:hypothetical protein